MEMKSLDAGVSSMDVIRDQITFILEQHTMLCKEQERLTCTSANNSSQMTNETNTTAVVQTNPIPLPPQLEIIILLESPGGSATDYGLAAQQIARLRNQPGIQVTICVDKVAASGGYMIACMASPGSLIAAPFAVVGSIGVIGQTINIHKSLQNWGVQPLVFRGGKDKAPIGLVGEITKEGLAKVQDMVDKTHRAFKRHVAIARPNMAPIMDQVATGDVWIASDALEIGMVDVLMTSDEYIMKKVRDGNRVLKLVKSQRPRFGFGAPHPYFPGVEAMGALHQAGRSMMETFAEFRLLLQKMNAISIDDPSTVAKSHEPSLL
jgi:serine protease SohB